MKISQVKYYILFFLGVWVEGSTFWLQIEISGFEFPELLWF